MGLAGDEVAAANQRRRNEELAKSSVGGVIESSIPAISTVVSLGTSLTAAGATGLVVASSVVAGLGIVDWFRKLGTAKVNENLELLGQATEDALSRVEDVLKEHGTAIGEIKRRLESLEFRDAMASASLQALRTTQQERLKRLALIIANGVKDDDLTPESVNDMMRAAVELTAWDIIVLGKMYDSQKALLSGDRLSFDWSEQVGHIWTGWNRIFGLQEKEHIKLRGALSRLQSMGFVAEAQTNFVKDGSLARQAFGLLWEGKKFYERLREIAI